MNVLGIETSCDETSVAVLSGDNLAANLIASQDFHVDFGGVVPELSSRAHLQIVVPLLKQALKKSVIDLSDVDLVCGTAGPGLIGALLVGLTFAKGLAYSLNKPFVPVNHIEGHIFSGFLMPDKPVFPYLCLVVSGGHTLLLLVEDDLRIRLIGTTIDDAAGEAFDKVAKLLGLEYPGGPQIQTYAKYGNPEKIDFPVAKCKSPYDFSFSGVKTSVLRFIQNQYGDSSTIGESDKFDIAASFQKSVVDALAGNTEKALNEYEAKSISLVGGVAANDLLQSRIKELGEKYHKPVVIPGIEFCGDNAAMIAYRGKILHQNGKNFGYDYKAFPGISDNNSFIK